MLAGLIALCAILVIAIGALTWHFVRRLRSLEVESDRFFDLSRDMVCIAGFDGYFKRVNPAFELTLGYSQEELLGRPIAEFVHSDDRAGTGGENRYLDRDGEIHWLEWTSMAVPEEDVIYAVARDVTDRRMLEQKMELLSRSDQLTGVFNRRRFDETLEAQLAHARRYRGSGALLIVDVDHFKQVNEEFGHAAGDEALRAVARLLASNLRQTDTLGRDAAGLVARLGGDEFALLLPETDAAGAEVVAARLVDAVASEPLETDGKPVQLGISIGAATFGEGDFPTAEELLAAADRAMYVVKAAGGGGASIESRP